MVVSPLEFNVFERGFADTAEERQRTRGVEFELGCRHYCRNGILQILDVSGATRYKSRSYVGQMSRMQSDAM